MGSNVQSERSLMIEERDVESMQIDPSRSRFPCCIVWSPLPVLSWFFPCVGHIGICREDEVILDFAGPNYVCLDNFTFGAPTRYIQLSKEQLDSSLHGSEDELMQNGGRRAIVTGDDALRKSTQEYQHHSDNILTCSCHSDVVNLAILIFIKGRYVSKLVILPICLPFVVVSGICLAFGGGTFLTYLAIFIFILVGWFLLDTYSFRKLIYV
ncbi:hypothetical protein BUALT_Bualt04G0007000 [Buddleja alternifolia]|uniref:Uncharacterized protein n=1 Tax=Buddleja alternifolia TaxID=168488 RepID=A0AAV6XWI7_9LAMI|nr:hypothetical protein BUALT_Bualt04G0007000 [Buddleja alternifolia]